MKHCACCAVFQNVVQITAMCRLFSEKCVNFANRATRTLSFACNRRIFTWFQSPQACFCTPQKCFCLLFANAKCFFAQTPLQALFWEKEHSNNTIYNNSSCEKKTVKTTKKRKYNQNMGIKFPPEVCRAIYAIKNGVFA